MACLGVLFSIDQKTVEIIEALSSDEKRVDYVKDVLEENYFHKYPQWVAELGKSWDALHRSLTDGKLSFDNGIFPLSHVVFGGEVLCANDSYVIILKREEQVIEIAKVVLKLSKEELERKYFLLDPNEYDNLVTNDDFEYTWQWFEDSKSFWQKAADENRSVLFTVDQ